MKFTVERRGKRWHVLDSKGKSHGSYNTSSRARARERMLNTSPSVGEQRGYQISPSERQKLPWPSGEGK